MIQYVKWSAVVSFLLFSPNLLFADDLCLTQNECFAACCPDGSAVCQQLCRNTCSNNSQTCPDFYYFCPYNTNATPFNFLEVTSSNFSHPDFSLTIYDMNGIEVREKATFNLPPLTRKDFDIHTIVGPNKFGNIVIESDLPLFASISRYYSQARGELTLATTTICKEVSRGSLFSNGE